jgi:hypothetical protein
MAERYAAWLGLLCWSCLATQAPAAAKAGPTEKDFRLASTVLLADPLGERADDAARVVLIFVLETPDAAVALGAEEMKWTAVGKDDKRSLPLLAAYLAGDAQSQLHSGVRRNDRYSGLLTLFGVYRQFKAKDKDFQIPEVEELLKLHQDDKLLPYLTELEKKKPTKLTPEDEAAIQKFLKGKK